MLRYPVSQDLTQRLQFNVLGFCILGGGFCGEAFSLRVGHRSRGLNLRLDSLLSFPIGFFLCLGSLLSQLRCLLS